MKLMVSMRKMRGFGEETFFSTGVLSTGVGRAEGAGDSTGSGVGDFFLRAKQIV
jgi:hypothetical protein